MNYNTWSRKSTSSLQKAFWNHQNINKSIDPWFLRCSKPDENQWHLNMFMCFKHVVKTHDTEHFLEPSEYHQVHWSLISALFQTQWKSFKYEPFPSYQTCYGNPWYRQPSRTFRISTIALILDFCVVHNHMKTNEI